MEKVDWDWTANPIILPLEGTSTEYNAAYVAFYIAEVCGAEVVGVHVGTPPKGKDIDEIAVLARELGVRFSLTTVESSDVAGAILKKSEELSAQLIVMSIRKKTLKDRIVGTVGEKVVKKAPCPVLLVHSPREEKLAVRSIERILVPVFEGELSHFPFKVVAALTSSATMPRPEILVPCIIRVPMTTSLDEAYLSEVLREKEKKFATRIGEYIMSTGVLFMPKVVLTRDEKEAVTLLAELHQTDLVVLLGRRPRALGLRLTESLEMKISGSISVPSIVAFP